MHGSSCAPPTSMPSSTSPRRLCRTWRQWGGNLVAVPSVSGQRGDWGQAAYNATKAAIDNFVRSLALDWGAQGVRLNAVAPALTLARGLTEGIATDEASLAPHVNRVPPRPAGGARRTSRRPCSSWPATRPGT